MRRATAMRRNANTIGNVAERLGGLHLPNFERLGFGPHHARSAASPPSSIRSPSVGRLARTSQRQGHDHRHWEMAGHRDRDPVSDLSATAFRPRSSSAFTAICGEAAAGQRPRVGHRDHRRAGRGAPAHRAADPLHLGRLGLPSRRARRDGPARDALRLVRARAGDARPAARRQPRDRAARSSGTPGNYARTPNRRDYALPPPPTILDRLGGERVYRSTRSGRFAISTAVTGSRRRSGSSITPRRSTERSHIADATDHGFVFVNLNDFDTKFGHRRDVRGYGDALERLDARSPRSRARIRPGDGLIFTADHGCDPTAPGTDHTREFVPYLEFGGGAGRRARDRRRARATSASGSRRCSRSARALERDGRRRSAVRRPRRRTRVQAARRPRSGTSAKRAIDVGVSRRRPGASPSPIVLAAMVGIVVVTRRHRRSSAGARRPGRPALPHVQAAHDGRAARTCCTPRCAASTKSTARSSKCATTRGCTRSGAFLRRTSIDELPNFVNVLLGEMAIVGPRPPLPDGSRALRRVRAAPAGGQAGRDLPVADLRAARTSRSRSGWRSTTRTSTRGRRCCDLAIIARTIPAVLRGIGAH